MEETYTYAVLPSWEKAIPLDLLKPSATTRTSPVLGSKRYTWFGSPRGGRNASANPYLIEQLVIEDSWRLGGLTEHQ